MRQSGGQAHTPVVLLGRQQAVWGYVGLMAANYVAIVLEVGLKMIPRMALLAVITAPLATGPPGV
jgi:1,4-dihydroxy-2-naphthoate octaprenyltransferase